MFEQLVDVQFEEIHAEWLLDIVIGSAFAALYFVLVSQSRGEHHHGQVMRLVVFLDSLAELVAVHHGHHHVGNHQVGHVVVDDFQRLLAVFSFQNAVVGLQLFAEEAEKVRVVVDQEQRGALLPVVVVGSSGNFGRDGGRHRVVVVQGLDISFAFRFQLLCGQCDREQRTATFVVFHGDCSAEHLCIFPCQVEPDATALMCLAVFCLIEPFKKVRLVHVADAGSIVGHADEHLLAVVETHGDVDASFQRCELVSVGQQVGHHAVDLALVKRHDQMRHVGVKCQRDAFVRQGSERFAELVDVGDQIAGGELYLFLSPHHAAQVQHLVDHHQQLTSIALNKS